MKRTEQIGVGGVSYPNWGWGLYPSRRGGVKISLATGVSSFSFLHTSPCNASSYCNITFVLLFSTPYTQCRSCHVLHPLPFFNLSTIYQIPAFSRSSLCTTVMYNSRPTNYLNHPFLTTSETDSLNTLFLCFTKYKKYFFSPIASRHRSTSDM